MNTEKARDFLDYAQSVVENNQAHIYLVKMLRGWDVFISVGYVGHGKSYYKVVDSKTFLEYAKRILENYCQSEYNLKQALEIFDSIGI